MHAKLSMIASLLILTAAGCHPHHKSMIQYHPHSDQHLPFSESVKAGDLLILSGQIGIDPATNRLVEGGIQAQTKQILLNIQSILKKRGLKMSNIIKCTIMLDDMRTWGKMNEVYITFFSKNLPARSAFGVDGLAMGAEVEIECWAGY